MLPAHIAGVGDTISREPCQTSSDANTVDTLDVMKTGTSSDALGDNLGMDVAHVVSIMLVLKKSAMS